MDRIGYWLSRAENAISGIRLSRTLDLLLLGHLMITRIRGRKKGGNGNVHLER